jgi:hypothetical protein
MLLVILPGDQRHQQSWTDGRMDGRMDGWTDRQTVEQTVATCNLQLLLVKETKNKLNHVVANKNGNGGG